jgi:hypothetical protein
LNVQKMLRSAGVECWIPQPSKSRDPKEPWKFQTTNSREDVLKDARESTARCFSKIDECGIAYLINNGG